MKYIHLVNLHVWVVWPNLIPSCLVQWLRGSWHVCSCSSWIILIGIKMHSKANAPRIQNLFVLILRSCEIFLGIFDSIWEFGQKAPRVCFLGLRLCGSLLSGLDVIDSQVYELERSYLGPCWKSSRWDSLHNLRFIGPKKK